MAEALVIATANVLRSLSRADARDCLHAVLGHEPDLVGLQEWGPSRRSILRETGRVTHWPRGSRSSRGPTYTWYSSLLGGCAVGARSERFGLLGCRSVLLDGFGRAERPDRLLGIEPPRLAAVATYEERSGNRRVALISYHLVSGVQVGGAYRHDRPLLARRHRHEVERLQDLVDQLREHGYDVYAVGDSNFDGLSLQGLTSAWAGRDRPGTLGRRSVDDVFGPGPAAGATLVSTASDHRALVVTA